MSRKIFKHHFFKRGNGFGCNIFERCACGYSPVVDSAQINRQLISVQIVIFLMCSSNTNSELNNVVLISIYMYKIESK